MMNTTTRQASKRVLAPASSQTQRYLERLLQQADIHINGNRPWDMQLNTLGVPERIFAWGNLGLGESYMDGEWEVEQLDSFIYRILHYRIQDNVKPTHLLWHVLKSRLLNRQNIRRAWQVGERHYDLGNRFYQTMLDPRMTYTCGYWQHAGNLQQAQEAKLDLICRKLQLQPGMKVLDIGCGWGSFMSYAAEHYGVRCVGVTISRQQAEWAQQRYCKLPLEFRLQDYRELSEHFDRIVSVGMFEHVGHKNYRTYMEVAHRCLQDDGLFLLHTIGSNERKTHTDAWIDKYVFPNGEIPSAGQIADAADQLFVTEDLQNFGADYDKTLMAWYHNFEQAWPEFRADLGERFFRMWRYYLLSCAGAFRARDLQLWQWVFSKTGGRHGVYQRVS